jgi:RNA polymerase subunit RPABC4/transcription elongation factor Spt4
MSARTEVSPWAARRLRAEELHDRYPFAAELLTLYLALVPVQEDAWSRARESPPAPEELPWWAGENVLPAVIEATAAAGPPALREAVLAAHGGEWALAGWLADEELDPVDRYLARASLGPVLDALGERAGAACAREHEHAELCPRCGGPPQLSWLAASGESLVNGPRSLLCARCGASWSSSRSACPACGETQQARLEVHTERWGDADEHTVFPHLRIAGCSTCSRYLIEIDMAHDERAVPEVDELAALPLDLYAADLGLRKLTPNLMGF